MIKGMIPLNMPDAVYIQCGIIKGEILPVCDGEIDTLLKEINRAIETGNYRFQPREELAELELEYVVDEELRLKILKSLKASDFRAKVKDKSKKAYVRIKNNYPPEALYIFKCKRNLLMRNPTAGQNNVENVKLYIKINNRTIPNKIMLIVSFHKDNFKKNK